MGAFSHLKRSEVKKVNNRFDPWLPPSYSHSSHSCPPHSHSQHTLTPSLLISSPSLALFPVKKPERTRLGYCPTHTLTLPRSPSPVHPPPFTLPRSPSPVHPPLFTLPRSPSPVHPPMFTLPRSPSPVHPPMFTLPTHSFKHISSLIRPHPHSFKHILSFVNCFSQLLKIISCQYCCMLEHVSEKVYIRNVVLKEDGKREREREREREGEGRGGRGRESR